MLVVGLGFGVVFALFGGNNLFGLASDDGMGNFIGAHARIISIAFSLALSALILLSKRGTQSNVQTLAERLGFQIKEEFGALSFGTSQMLEGQYSGRLVRFFNYQVLGEKNRPWLAVATACRMPTGASLQVAPNRWYIRAAFMTRRLSATWEGDKRVNGADTPRLESAITGDPAFDEAYVVRTSDPDWAKKILAPKVRNALLAARESTGGLIRLSVEGDEVRYSICGKFNQPNRVDHLVAQMDFICGLACQIEASAPRTLNSPSSSTAMWAQTPSVPAEPRKKHYFVAIIYSAIGVLSLLLIEVVPLFEKKFDSAQAKPPLPMQFLFSASHFWAYWWWVLLLVGYGFMKWSTRTPANSQ